MGELGQVLELGFRQPLGAELGLRLLDGFDEEKAGGVGALEVAAALDKEVMRDGIDFCRRVILLVSRVVIDEIFFVIGTQIIEVRHLGIRAEVRGAWIHLRVQSSLVFSAMRRRLGPTLRSVPGPSAMTFS